MLLVGLQYAQILGGPDCHLSRTGQGCNTPLRETFETEKIGDLHQHIHTLVLPDSELYHTLSHPSHTKLSDIQAGEEG